ncbi:hypothetical protein CH306_10355 [Rhodococcus sp. 15-725-2-2b]|uniref:DUF5313 family protein n=1 Tax=unclassified Rhodococcus (in: high G+C Gram-positive bacteria) TaxID=192944 RepID=UPI000B9B6676|nr:MULTISPECIES: DUF5313 family protein [unclassified Rhodococcus (in: high G+C Gram-positive bacteria)]OZC61720.1 hypothetical protein CH277_26350 [Rhodococcus sp. 06-469-3-2]OZC74860.1 hypothetical protein CH274_23095 [Rhodococcus sp. 06-418-5]OZD42967.1 hypothetical protein CH264_18940 [Rhodococcus sp. 06-1477-1A]OZE11089.1 hypothetical protein CH250_11515 [Rhodococcus sp. 05-2255-3C]OZE14245.1 hypothetical protein CH249_07460 [Rhodococcus sp. 05-2255-3B1]
MNARPTRTRPPLGQWLGYAVLGRKLPDEFQGWVRRDLVGPGATPRHILRSMIPFLPIFIGFFVLFPGAIWLRASMVLLSLLLALFYTAAYMDQNRARRLEIHGLPAGLKSEKKTAEMEREREKYRRNH